MKKLVLLLFFSLFLQANDFTKIRQNYKEFLNNNNLLSRLSKLEKKAYIEGLDKKSKELLKNTKLFKEEKELLKPQVLLKSFKDLSLLSLAYSTKNARLYKNKSLLKKLEKALDILCLKFYKIGGEERGNWWIWEIGIAKELNKIVILLFDELKNKDFYLKSSLYFQPSPFYSGMSEGAKYSSSPKKRLSEGANRADTAFISFIRAALLEDELRLKLALKALLELNFWAKKGNGFYEDGSFIQHNNVPYNGTYGAVLLQNVALMLYLSKNTSLKIDFKNLELFYEAAFRGYSFLLINGGVADAVSGRAISRDKSSELSRAGLVLSALTLLFKANLKDERLKILIKRALVENSLKNTIEKTNNLFIKQSLKEIDKNTRYIPYKGKARVFYNMDRAVYLGEGGFKVVISMHSKRIANYESMNGENKLGFFTSNGASYIYDKNSKRSLFYWPSLDFYHISGTTQAQMPFKKPFKKPFLSSTFAGGVSSGTFMLVGMDFISTNTRAKKSWFLIDDALIALGSNISSTSKAKVHTTIINILDIKNDFKIQLLKAAKLEQRKEKRQGSWARIGGKSEKIIEKSYILKYINHGIRPKNDSYFYSLSLKEIKKSDISLLQADANAHALEYKGIRAINFWRASSQGIFTSYSSLSLIALKKANKLILYLSDPSQENQNIRLKIAGKYALKTKQKNISLKSLKNASLLSLAFLQRGQSVKVELERLF